MAEKQEDRESRDDPSENFWDAWNAWRTEGEYVLIRDPKTGELTPVWLRGSGQGD